MIIQKNPLSPLPPLPSLPSIPPIPPSLSCQPPSATRPSYKFYDKLEDMLYDSDNEDFNADMSKFPTPPIKIEDISSTKDLLTFIDYVNQHELQYKNKCFKYLVKAEAPLRLFDTMVGMYEIKKNIANHVLYYAKKLGQGNGKLDMDTSMQLNTVIYGAPGTGKTTVAQLIADIYYSMGVLKTNKIVFGRRDNMIGQYLGQTAPKTRKFLESAAGGMVILDEMYQFGAATDGNRDSYAKEFIDTLNQWMTDPEVKDRAPITAMGYRKQSLASFFAQNDGLVRRFKWSYTIETYGPHELWQIFLKQVKQHKFTVVAKSMVFKKTGVAFFAHHKEMFEFGGGDTETLLEKCKLINEKRTISAPHDEGKLNETDIEKGFEQYKSYVADRKGIKSNEPPLNFYT